MSDNKAVKDEKNEGESLKRMLYHSFLLSTGVFIAFAAGMTGPALAVIGGLMGILIVNDYLECKRVEEDKELEEVKLHYRDKKDEKETKHEHQVEEEHETPHTTISVADTHVHEREPESSKSIVHHEL
jgi:uncharacterized membrane protein YhiD involved in acid resistance